MASKLALAKRNADRQKARNLEDRLASGEAQDSDDNQVVPLQQRGGGIRAVAAEQQRIARAAAAGDVEGAAVTPQLTGRATNAIRPTGRFTQQTGRTQLGTAPTAPNDEQIKLLTGGLADGSAGGQLASLDNNAVSADPTQAQARGQVTTGQAIQLESQLEDLNVPDNVLLDYVSLQYHIVLSMVPLPKVVGIQRKIPIGASTENIGSFDELQRRIVQEGSVPIASTGDVFQSDFSEFSDQQGTVFGEAGNVIRFVGGRNYYNIESMTFDSAMAPTPRNQFINAMLTGKMVIVEPHGFKLKEDLVTVGNKIGYSGINPGRFLYRMDIFFSGYNQDTGEWIPFIELNTRVRKTRILTYYINFTTVEAKVDHTGTTYDISYAPAGHAAYRPEEVIVNSGAIATGNRSFAETFGGFLERMAQSMEKAVRERTHQQVKRKYEFKAPPELLAAPFFTGNFEFKKGFIKNDPKGGSFLTPARDVNVIGIVEAALQDIAFVWNAFLKKNDRKHLTPRIHWGIRFNVLYDSGPNPGTNDFETMTIQYIIEPFVTYKGTRINNRADMAEVVETDSQVRRIREMLKFGMINRVYNYINTSENLEVIDLDIALKNFYYHTMYKPKPSPAGAGNFEVESGATQSKQQTARSDEAQQTGTESDKQSSEVPRNQENSVDSALQRLFGREIDNPSAACDSNLLRNPFDVYGGGFGEMPTTDFQSMVGSQDQNDRDEYQANLNDHIKNDLLTINMQVRGDPIWLLTPYGESGNLISTSSQTNNVQGPTALVRPQSSRCFFLRMFAPTQDDYMNPDRMDASTACSVIGGFYEVSKVVSKFEGGKFTQQLEAYKINHLNYVENFIGIIPNSQVDSSSPTLDNTVPQRNSRPPDIGGT